MKNLAFIPARSGSKGLPDKNIKLLHGKPLIVYAIEAAIESELFEDIVVSTDSEKYAAIALEYGANVPFLRSSELSGDLIATWDVVKDYLTKSEEKYDTVMVLQPTSPLRKSQDIKNAFSIMNEKNADSVISICECEHPPLWANTLPNDDSLNGFIKDEANRPRQELDTYYRLNGAIYLVKCDALYLGEGFELYGNNSYALKMSKESSVDIDGEMDFILAEAIMYKRLNT